MATGRRDRRTRVVAEAVDLLERLTRETRSGVHNPDTLVRSLCSLYDGVATRRDKKLVAANELTIRLINIYGEDVLRLALLAGYNAHVRTGASLSGALGRVLLDAHRTRIH